MLKKFITPLAIVVFAFMQTVHTASAADLVQPQTQAHSSAPVPVIESTWTGFGFGVQADVGFPDGNSQIFGGKIGDFGTEIPGIGIHATYLYQFPGSKFVVGADTSLTGLFGPTDTTNRSFFGGFLTTDSSLERNWKGNLRGRLGWTPNDQWLLTVNGGLAGTSVSTDANARVFGTSFANAGGSETLWGWTIGAAVDYRIDSNWTVGLDYSYSDYGSWKESVNIFGFPTSAQVKYDLTESALQFRVTRWF